MLLSKVGTYVLCSLSDCKKQMLTIKYLIKNNFSVIRHALHSDIVPSRAFSIHDGLVYPKSVSAIA